MPNNHSTSLVFAGSACLLIAVLAGTFTGCRSPQAAESSATTYSRLLPTEVIKNAVPCEARPLPLSDVRLTGGPLKHAQELDARYLLELEPDQIMYYLRQEAGLKPKASHGDAGWDGPGRNLTGHIAGHYLSAVSYMYAATGDPRFKQRADYMVEQLKDVQDAQGDGYIGALMGTERVGGTNRLVKGKVLFQELARGEIRSGGFDLNGMWSPWYVEHKIFAGLRDAYRLTGDRTALKMEIKFAGWVGSIVTNLDDAQDQRMLNTEFGGMNEVLADLYADTGDKRWLALSDKFEHRSFVEPLAHQEDDLGGRHENMEIPKIIGDLARYLYTGNETDGSAAKFFWDQVVFHHSFATGGAGHDEYFGPADKLNNIVEGRDDESCPVYNMLKLTRTLFALHPDIKYADFQERAVFNHVLASIDPNDGRTCYMVPVGQGVQHEYQDMFRDFTCCVGTGMEDMGILGDGIYYESGDKLWVNLYTPSRVEWKRNSVRFEMQADLPDGENATLKLALKSPAKFTLALRRPAWAGDGFAVTINGRPVQDLPQPDSYVELIRTWRNGDTVALVLPKQLHAEPLPDNSRRVALMWGPLVLAGDLGPENRRGGYGRRAQQPEEVPVFVAAAQPVAEWLKPVPGQPGMFRTDGVGRPAEVTFKPFYQLPERTYGIYWDLFTPAEWEKKSAELAAEREHQHQLELATVAFVQPGEMQMERDFNEQGEQSWPDRIMGRPARRGRDWFSFDLPVDPAHPLALVVTYYSDEWRPRTFDILVDGQRVGEQTVEKGATEPHFFDAEYTIPANLVQGKQKVTVRFQATQGNEIAAVFGLRVIRADKARQGFSE
ncbi:MAG TPA: beta-L-arabinofuranosidase domain-containing protein [Verrucomicrobiae bacterium]|nr:beta-L-arabinofuranosidase domain-containing protein [Verrucomicrobiae bacterium]